MTQQESPEHGSPFRVAYIMSRFPKLTETFVYQEILMMETLGVHVELYPLLRETPRVMHAGVERLTRRAHFHPFLSGSVVAANWLFFRRSPRQYVRLWWDVLRGTWGSANFFIGALALFPKCIRFASEMQQGIDHIHAHFSNHPAVAAFIASRVTGIPFSFTAHGSDLHVDRHMLKQKVAGAAFVVTVSSYNKDLIVRECGESARDKVAVIHCGVDPRVFAPRKRSVEAGPLRILCVGSFEEVKGHKHLVEACRILRTRGLDFECHLVGEGPLRSRIESELSRKGLSERFRFHGGLPRLEVVRILSEADVVVLPSVPTRNGKREGIPVALMEAMASGVPVISSVLSGIPELVESGREGILVPPADPVALADALQLLAANKELRDSMGRAGREKVLQDFDLRTNAATLCHLFLSSRCVDTPAGVGKVAVWLGALEQ